jgi:gamma-tubulin complex component 5
MEVYGELFVLLLQVRRAKWVLDGILVRRNGQEEASKVFWATRGKLSWFVK